MPLNDPKMLAFLVRAGGGHMRAAFDSSIALADPTVEHLHALHPLVRAIVKIYDDHPERISPVASVQVTTSVAPEHDYFFLWAEVVEHGLQAGRSIWAECLSVDGETRLEPDQAEQLLHHVVVGGKKWDGFEAPPA